MALGSVHLRITGRVAFASGSGNAAFGVELHLAIDPYSIVGRCSH